MKKKKIIKLSTSPVMACQEIIKTVHEWEAISESTKETADLVGSFNDNSQSAITLQFVCVELRKLLEGETRIRGEA